MLHVPLALQGCCVACKDTHLYACLGGAGGAVALLRCRNAYQLCLGLNEGIALDEACGLITCLHFACEPVHPCADLYLERVM